MYKNDDKAALLTENFKVARIKCIVHCLNLIVKDIVTEFRIPEQLAELRAAGVKFMSYSETRFFGILNTLQSIPAGGTDFIYYKAEYIETFTILCDLEKRLESHDAVISNVNVNFDDITDRLRTLGTEIALFAVERIEARLTGADNLLTKAIKLKDFLQPKFKPSDYNLELLSNYVLGVNELFSGVVDQILLEDVMMHFNSSEIENKRNGSALNLWCSRLRDRPSVKTIIDFLQLCEVIIVSECSVEQLFSQFGHIIGQRRTNITPEMLHSTFMVKSCTKYEYLDEIKKKMIKLNIE
ncbi:Ribonuclease_H-like superfamily [Hexamita inflata]|uniref:Ribonuclease H-like superfamily n=1 Tax=Hexamita inflata TaxID=28002 RepID=A0AA86NH14_9EUKA|nr:Ribonuclease H-like superfamily [Hexamita inflata]